jgi:3-oxoacyl-[acyl-carrier protein] reductase
MKSYFVTGGSRGLGLAICERLLSEGHKVVTGSRRSSPPLDLLLQTHPDRLTHHAIDFGDPPSARAFWNSGGLIEGFDGFVANAAIGTEGLLTLTAEQTIRECVEVNLVATMLLAREVIKGMLGKGHGGSLVFISSVAATRGLTGLSVYAATKGALLAFSRSLAREYGDRGIRSNCILPGFLETDMTRSLPEAQRDRVRRRAALGTLGQPQDLVEAVLFLLGEQARHITGTELVVDGGLTA